MSQSAQQLRFCTSRDGTRIAHATCGAGPPLVWTAGWSHNLELDWDSPVWRPWLSLLTRRHTLVRYDMRGCGLSDREGVEFSFERLVEDFEAVLEATSLEQFVLFGWRPVRRRVCHQAGEPSCPLAGYVRNSWRAAPRLGNGGGASPAQGNRARLAQRHPGIR
jgi:hypothetical protein